MSAFDRDYSNVEGSGLNFVVATIVIMVFGLIVIGIIGG